MNFLESKFSEKTYAKFTVLDRDSRRNTGLCGTSTSSMSWTLFVVVLGFALGLFRSLEIPDGGEVGSSSHELDLKNKFLGSHSVIYPPNPDFDPYDLICLSMILDVFMHEIRDRNYWSTIVYDRKWV